MHSERAPTFSEDRARRWTIASSASAIVSALIASACCVGPLVFALLGIGGAGLLVKFEPYRPYFMAVTFALLGAGFYFTYRKSRAIAGRGQDDCCATEGCTKPKVNRAGKIMLWVATVLVTGFLVFPYLATWLFG